MELRDIVKRVILSEKGAKPSALNQYFLEVDTKATKPEIRKAVSRPCSACTSSRCARPT